MGSATYFSSFIYYTNNKVSFLKFKIFLLNTGLKPSLANYKILLLGLFKLFLFSITYNHSFDFTLIS